MVGATRQPYLLEDAGRLWLLDCGPAALFALKRAGFQPDRLEAIFLSHLHGDHFGGLPFFLIDYLYNGQPGGSLVVAGPPGTEARVRDLTRLMYGEKAIPFVQFTVLEPDSPGRAGGSTGLPLPGAAPD